MTSPKPTKLYKILIANGVNLDLLGKREPDIYGSSTLLDLEAFLQEQRAVLLNAGLPRFDLSLFQSNDEGAFLSKLSEGWDGAIINAGAWTHTSLALADRLAALSLPFIEVHLSNLSRREPYRHHSYAAPHARGVVFGAGFDSYSMALYGLLRLLGSPN